MRWLGHMLCSCGSFSMTSIVDYWLGEGSTFYGVWDKYWEDCSGTWCPGGFVEKGVTGLEEGFGGDVSDDLLRVFSGKERYCCCPWKGWDMVGQLWYPWLFQSFAENTYPWMKRLLFLKMVSNVYQGCGDSGHFGVGCWYAISCSVIQILCPLCVLC